MAFQADCPQCGAPIEFSIANSVVTVCESCGTASGRKGDALENYGKVADLVDTKSPLQIDVVGETKGVPFKITGRTQLKHSAGGIWDEWYVAFRDGKRWGWLAEARGRYYLSFRKKLPEGHNIPAIDTLGIEDEVMIPKLGMLRVVEIGQATAVSAEGEIPYEFHPGETYYYADLEGPGRKFATLDYSTSPPTVYAGQEFPLKLLGIDEHAPDREDDVVTAEAAELTCPQCSGTIELVAPDEAERVGCPYCGSLLDVTNGGNLKFLNTLKIRRKPTIPLGTKGTLDGTEYTIIGYMERSVHAEGKEYPWYEYLLYAPRKPFHWLIESQNHWTFSKPVSAGEVSASWRFATHKGRSYKLFDRGTPKVKSVIGEFYWKVEAGERVGSADYISPPYLLSREESLEPVIEAEDAEVPPVIDPRKRTTRRQQPAKEVNYTVGRYVPVEEIESAFGVKNLKRPFTVAPNQPYKYKNIYSWWAIALALCVMFGLLVWVSAPRKKIFEQSFALSSDPTTQTQFIEEPLTLTGGRNLAVKLRSGLANRWSYLELDLIDAKGKKRTITVPVQYSDTEGTKFVGALPAGTYNMRAAFKWQGMTTETQNVTVSIREGVPRMYYWVVLVVLVSILPIGIAIHHFMFEAQRWAESGVT